MKAMGPVHAYFPVNLLRHGHSPSAWLSHPAFTLFIARILTGRNRHYYLDLERRTLGKFKLEGVEGDDDVQGQLGLGYNLADQGFLNTGGAQGNHIFAGLDYTFGTGLDVTAGINTIGDYNAPDERVTLSCDEGFTLEGDVCEPTEAF